MEPAKIRLVKDSLILRYINDNNLRPLSVAPREQEQVLIKAEDPPSDWCLSRHLC